MYNFFDPDNFLTLRYYTINGLPTILIACSSPCVCVLMQCWGRGAAPQLEEADMSAAFCVFVVRCLGRVSLTSRSRCAACLSRAVPTSAQRDRYAQ
jgi:hypothetical protein